MKSILLTLLTFVICSIVLAQEELYPLYVNSNFAKVNTEKVGDIDGLFIYEFDTLSLPFLDDFSENHFPSFTAEASDPNVISETHFRIEVGGTPVAMGSWYMEDTTYHFQYDTVTGFGFDSIILINKTALPDVSAEVFDIDDYPITSVFDNLWPSYNIHDSVWNGTAIDDTIFIEFQSIDVFQDTATIFMVSSVPSDTNIYWEDNYVYHNYTYATNIQTLGIASFDGLDENGFPYDFSSVNTNGEADVLTSKPINLSGLAASDSVYMSFLIEPGGYGEIPDNNDSIILQFWSPLTLEWNTVWRKKGYSSDFFDMQLLKITSGIYFQNGFQFRFKSYGGLAGSLDVWHLDYVYLDELRSYEDTITSDWAFAEPSPSFIKDYTSMPWPHYEFDPEGNMITDHSANTYNSDNGSLIINENVMFMELWYENNLLNSLDYNNNLGNVPASDYADIDYVIPTTFWFDTSYADTCADFQVKQWISSSTANATDLKVNDTLRHTQHFSNYYAYDDGTAEAAYGLVQNGALLAYKYNLAPGLTDTLRAISMHFSPNSHDVSSSSFFLQVWDNEGGQPGALIYTTDTLISTLYYPEYNNGNNGFVEYVLPDKVPISGTYYIGWKQSSSDRLNIGFDLNINNQDKIFYKTSSSWSNTIYEGSLMMRPVFVSDKDILLSIQENNIWNPEINIFPNPVDDQLTIGGDISDVDRIELFDLQGRKIISKNTNLFSFSTINFPNGVYLLKLYSADNQQIQKKVIISH